MKTAECVSPKHPDKLCDQISDRILDYCLRQDPNSRTAIEVMGAHGEIYIAGEVTTRADIGEQALYGQLVDLIGLTTPVIFNIVKQSSEIAQGVDIGGAGDQGIMIGYATAETESRIPLALELARNLNHYLYGIYKTDGKTQITLSNYNAIDTIVASFQKAPAEELTANIMKWLEDPKIKLASVPHIYANPAGDWNVGGFDADTGLTGRKLAVDNYGPEIPIGGGAFSGKDATKVDRSAAYFARAVAVTELEKRIAQGGTPKSVTVRIAYAIGRAEPVEATAIIDDGVDTYTEDIRGSYDFTPQGIIEQLDLLKPQYETCAAYGHFGAGRTWDKPLN